MSAALHEVRRALRRLGSPERERISRSFFKTGPGEYGEGDRFLGVPVPDIRRLVRSRRGILLCDALALLRSPIHEERLLALFLLVDRYTRGTEDERTRVYRTYLANTRYVSNWDLVDSSAPQIVGRHLLERPRPILRTLARSRNLWERRIAIVATMALIARREYADTLAIATLFLRDPHDLIHKATGWMLREVGKRDRDTLEQFLRTHASHMPRTMLRYAIERFPERERLRYLRGSAR